MKMNVIDYDFYVLTELNVLEELSKEYNSELLLLSKRIRIDIWIREYSKQLYYVLNRINIIYKYFVDTVSYFDFSLIIEYVKLLYQHHNKFNPHLNEAYFISLIEKLKIENARVIIEKQWVDINRSEDGLKSFQEIFDDIFKNCFEKHKDVFISQLSPTDCLCRVVNDKHPINRDRFIPRNSTTNNRWNPPGRSFLYLSYSKEFKHYSAELSINEYIYA